MKEEYITPKLFDNNDADDGEGSGNVSPRGVPVAFLVLAGVYTVVGGVTMVLAGGAYAVNISTVKSTVG